MLQVFIYFNLFLAGAAVALAIWYAYAHINSKKAPKEAVKDQPSTIAIKSHEQLLKSADARFLAIIEHAADELQYDLKDTSDLVSDKLKSLGASISDTEMQRYKSSLEEIRTETESTLKNAAADVEKHQQELHAALDKRRQELEQQLAQDYALEKQRFIDMLDKKLAGAVTAFLLESLGTDADLGAQNAYLMKTLEENKAALIKELSDGAA